MVGLVSQHLVNGFVCGYVGGDCKLMIWELCTNKHQASVLHDKEVNYLSFNLYNKWVIATTYFGYNNLFSWH